MRFRYRLIDMEGTDLGPFVSRRQDWKPGDQLGRSKGEDMVVMAIIEPDESADFESYLVVSPVGGNGGSEADNARREDEREP